MSMTSARSNLQTAMKDLLIRWDRIKEKWDDPVSRDIEKNLIDQLEPRVKSAVGAMGEMDEVLMRAMSECS